LKGISKEFKIGSIVIICIALLFVGINYLKGINPFQKQAGYFAVYEDVNFLSESSPVILNGYKVGMVKSREMLYDGSGNILVEFIINDERLKIPVDSRAKIFSADLFGTKAILLELGESFEYSAPGDTITGEIEVDLSKAIRKELEPLKQKTDELIGGIDDIITNLNAVFEDDATKSLPEAFESLQITMKSLERTALNLDEIVEENGNALSGIFSHLESITANLDNNNESISSIITNFESISDSLAKSNLKETILKADQTLEGLADIVASVERGEGSLGMLMKSDSLHNALVKTNVDVQHLVDDIYENPWRYIHVSILGKKQEKKYTKQQMKQIREMVDEALEEQQNQSE